MEVGIDKPKDRLVLEPLGYLLMNLPRFWLKNDDHAAIFHGANVDVG